LPIDLEGPLRSPGRLRKVALGIYLLALLVRFVFLYGFHRVAYTRPEPVRIAISLARNGRFADPYVLPTGPTAHSAPLYPFLIAPIYKFWGDTRTADSVRFGLAALAASAEYALLPYVSSALAMGTLPGVVAGIGGAVLPLHFWQECSGEFETAWIALFLQLSVIRFVRWIRAPSFQSGGIRTGLWCGFGILLAPNLLLAFCGFTVVAAVVLWRHFPPGAIRWSAAVGLTAIALILPWTIRNHQVIGGWFLVRDNFGLELNSSNNDYASPDSVTSHHTPFIRVREPGGGIFAASEVKRKGELQFQRDSRREALAWIRGHPVRFVQLIGARMRNFWFPIGLPPRSALALGIVAVAGIAGLLVLWRWNRLAAMILGSLLAFYPAVYYVVKNNLRYQHPIYWVLLLVSTAMLLRFLGWRRAELRKPDVMIDVETRL